MLINLVYHNKLPIPQKQLADAQSAVKSMEKSLRARPEDAPVSEDDKDREIKLLTSEVHLAQVQFHKLDWCTVFSSCS